MNPKNWRKEDSYYPRECQKYGKNPIPSREFILQWMEAEGRPLRVSSIVRAFGLSATEGEFLTHRLKAMTHAGQLTCDRKGRLGITQKMDLLSGEVIAHPDGYGFFSPENEDEPDGYLAPIHMASLMHGDKILARRAAGGKNGKYEYSPVEILTRGQTRLVGKLQSEEGLFFVVPENPRLPNSILIPPEALGAAQVEDVVSVEIRQYPSKNRLAVGAVRKVLGNAQSEGLAVTVAIENYALPVDFSPEALAEAEALPDAVLPEDCKGRLDLRHLPFVTIDDETARDFDDALFAETRGENIRLYVAIADVSHYVRTGSALDREAQNRGTSVYFPDRVLPMLPEKLSNGLCSLNPKLDRLVMVCEMSIDPSGHIKRAQFHEAVIHSQARLTYNLVEALIFDEDAATRAQYPQLLAPLSELKSVYQRLAQARTARAALEFDLPEAKFHYDAQGNIDAIACRLRLEAHKLVEEAMIAANVCAAQCVERHHLPALYRVHDAPEHEKVAKLAELLARLGLKWPGSEAATPRDFAAVLRQVQGKSTEGLLQKMILRAMAPALYYPQNRGHFGLALSHYAHFTSPIRRYPDLLVHRALRAILRHTPPERYDYSPIQMSELGKHCSQCERRADDATRDAMEVLKCEFMQEHLGETFAGQISNVTSFGLFVTLDEFFIDGLVHISTLSSDYYHFDPTAFTLRGEHSGRVYHMTDPLRVQVVRVDPESRQIDFVAVEEGGKKKRSKK